MASSGPDYIIKCSSAKSAAAYINPTKRVLKEHGKAEIHGAGSATASAIIASERLMSYGYATLDQLETMRLEGSNTSKVVIRLSKAAGFDKAEETFLATQAQTQQATS
jgi:hypothetical protein